MVLDFGKIIQQIVHLHCTLPDPDLILRTPFGSPEPLWGGEERKGEGNLKERRRRV